MNKPMKMKEVSENSLRPAWGWPDYGSAADRDRERTPGTSDEWTDDDPPETSEAWKIMKEANQLQNIAQRLLAGEEIDWDNN